MMISRPIYMDGLVPFDPPDEHTSTHAGMIKELLDMRDGINEYLHLSRTVGLSAGIQSAGE